jgi:hypothetical protein
MRVNSEDEVIARANSLIVGRAACETVGASSTARDSVLVILLSTKWC